MEKRIITTDVTEEDFSLEGNLRPQTLDDYIGHAPVAQSGTCHYPFSPQL